MITGHVFDASALADLATGKTIYVRARVRASIAEQATIIVPAAALTRAWQIVPDFGRTVLERLPQMQTVSVDELDEVIGQQAGLLAAGVPELTVDAAQAAWSARWRRWPLVTADPQQYAAIPGLHIEPLP